MNNSKQELQLLYRISQTVSSRQHDISQLLNEVLQIMESELGVLRGTLTLRKQGTEVLNIEASTEDFPTVENHRSHLSQLAHTR